MHNDTIVADTHSDILCAVADRWLHSETEVLSRVHLPKLREGGVNKIVVSTLYVEETPEIEFCKIRAEVERTVARGLN